MKTYESLLIIDYCLERPDLVLHGSVFNCRLVSDDAHPAIFGHNALPCLLDR